MSDKIIQLNEDLIKNDLKDLVRNSVEETLNALLDKEAEEKLKGIPFETAIIERYRRRESSVVEALIEMYLAGVSIRRVEDITEALWGTKVSPPEPSAT